MKSTACAGYFCSSCRALARRVAQFDIVSLCASFRHAFQPQVLVDDASNRTNTAQHNMALRCAMLWEICNFHISSKSLKTDQIKSITWSISRLHVCRPTLNKYNNVKIPLRNAGVSGDLSSALVRLRMIFLTQYQIVHRSNVIRRASSARSATSGFSIGTVRFA